MLGPEFGVKQLREMVDRDPEKVVLHSFRTIEVFLRREHSLDRVPISQVFEAAHKKGDTDDLLHNQLKTLSRLRNDVVHGRHKAGVGDALIAVGTLQNFMDNEWARLEEEGKADSGPEMSVYVNLKEAFPKRLDWRDFQEACRRFFEREFGETLAEEVTIELKSGAHRFDLAALDRSAFIECKSYTWLKSGKRPSAKWAQAQMACRQLMEVSAKRKILAFQDDTVGGKSLAHEFVRLNKLLIIGIEVWRYWEGRFEMVWGGTPSTGRAIH